ncbi:MAG TPA: nucleotidyltransferase [Spirochaetota bacterium]|nr:nucleotidyltransferase [Spirochaetota bacterium]
MLNSDYREILQIFLEEHVKFIIIGAYALGVHGMPRATGDIDIFVRADAENSRKIYQALIRFGAPVSDLTPLDFTAEGIIFQIGVVPRRVDILTSIDGISFDEAYEDKVTAEVEGLTIPVLSVESLIRNKEASGREKDILDVKILKKHLGRG